MFVFGIAMQPTIFLNYGTKFNNNEVYIFNMFTYCRVRVRVRVRIRVRIRVRVRVRVSD